MASATAFEWLCNCLESATDFDRLEARGTVRIALKRAGLEAKTLSAEHVRVVLEKLMPEELETRGVPDAASTCTGLIRRLSEIPVSESSAADFTPEAVFARLG
jgi:hypothetical protein